MEKQSILIPWLFMLLFICSVFNSSAQILPNKQTVSLRAPANVKIDGKATEWGQMKDYNKATNLNYTIANDDKKLYLVVQSTNPERKIVVGGITLVIQNMGEKNDKGAKLIKFPYYKEKNHNIYWSFDMVNREGDSDEKIKDPDGKILAGKVATANKNLRAAVKWIYTKNVLGKDSVLSIYNEAGIEAMNAFDKTTTYTSELSIDLSLLGLSAKDASKFSYHILVNDDINKMQTGFTITGVGSNIGPNGVPLTAEQVEQGRKALETINAQMAASAATTDFWGEYSLAK